jgi:subfamily B ATP-binding cassette protein MsbA
MMYTPIKRLSRVNANIQQAMAAATRIFEMLDTHSEVLSAQAPLIEPLKRGIEFKDVSFAYDDGRGSRC